MKRFFKPIEKDGSAKKPTRSTNQEESEKKEASELEETNSNGNTMKKEPLKFVTWNANSLLLRVKNNWPEFSKFVSDINPDVIAIQVKNESTFSISRCHLSQFLYGNLIKFG